VDSDDVLVARCQEYGDDDAFAELVRRHRTAVFRLALSILGPGFAGDAEEVTQEVFLRVHHALRSFRGDAQFSSWLYRIAFNQAVNLKARVRYRAPHATEDALADRPSADPSPFEQLDASRRRHALAEAIAALPEVYQAALRLHYWMGSSIGEVAELLLVPDNTVKSYLHRARRLLRVRLREQGYDGV